LPTGLPVWKATDKAACPLYVTDYDVLVHNKKPPNWVVFFKNLIQQRGNPINYQARSMSPQYGDSGTGLLAYRLRLLDSILQTPEPISGFGLRLG